MSGFVKNAVRTYIEKRTGRISRTKHFTQVDGGYTSCISIKCGSHTYTGNGWGTSKRTADQEAYNEIFCSMVLDGHEIEGRHAIAADMYGEKAAEVRKMLDIPAGKSAWISPRIRQALARLQSHSDPNLFPALNEFALTTCNKRTFWLTVRSVKNSDPLQFYVTASIKLPSKKVLKTAVSIGHTKTECEQEVMKLLVDQIFAHYDYVP